MREDDPAMERSQPDSAAWQGRPVLVTGGLGFIGSTLARRLVGLGANVTIIDSLIPEYGGNMINIDGIAGKVRVNISDMRDPYSLRYLVEGQEVIFNLAGQTSHMDSMTEPFSDLQINCVAQLSLLEICKKYNRDSKVIFASTRQIYGRPKYLPVDENHPLHPVDVNGVNKLAGENYHLLYHDVYGIKTAALRLTNIYGPRMRIKDARQTFLGIWIRAALEGKEFEVWGGEQLRDFCYVDDAVEAMLQMVEVDNGWGKVFNVGGDQVISLLSVAQALSSIVGTGFNVREFPADRKLIDIGDYYTNDDALRRLTGWKPKVCLEDGLLRTVQFYRTRLGHYV